MADQALLVGKPEDVEDMRRFLLESGVPENRIKTLGQEQATADGITSALTGMIHETKAGDRLVMAFRGPGAQTESDPKGPARLVLDVDPDGTFYIIGGQSEPGESNPIYTGAEYLKKRMTRLTMYKKAWKWIFEDWTFFDLGHPCLEPQNRWVGPVKPSPFDAVLEAMRIAPAGLINKSIFQTDDLGLEEPTGYYVVGRVVPEKLESRGPG